MARLIAQTEHVARKEHYCMASDFINEGGNLRGYTFTFSEWRAIIKARDNNWKIIPGQKYLKQFVSYEGSAYTFKAIPEIHAICLKYDYYQE